MDTIAKAIKQEMKHIFNEDESVKLHVQLNELGVLTYFDKNRIRIHQYQRYNSKGEFVKNQNSQQKQSLTCILAVGVTRVLFFSS